jgi:hypothetical protein
MKLRLLEWDIKPLKISSAYAELYHDRSQFPEGTVRLDSAMLMENLKHEWHKIPIIPV